MSRDDDPHARRVDPPSLVALEKLAERMSAEAGRYWKANAPRRRTLTLIRGGRDDAR